MRRRHFITAFGAAPVSWTVHARAQQLGITMPPMPLAHAAEVIE